MNPFDSDCSTTFFTDKIREQIKDLDIGDCIELETFGETLAKARMTLRHVSKHRFKTKVSDGALWIKRIQ